MKRLFRQVGFAIALTLVVPLASAHAQLDRAVPAAGSVVRASPKEVRLKFTQRLEPAFSRVLVFDPRGKQVDGGDSRVDAADPTVLRVTLPTLSSGRYRVAWRVLSIDTHVSEGDFTFDVAP
jgi:methionine-rich copper-binding protein CopC